MSVAVYRTTERKCATCRWWQGARGVELPGYQPHYVKVEAGLASTKIGCRTVRTAQRLSPLSHFFIFFVSIYGGLYAPRECGIIAIVFCRKTGNRSKGKTQHETPSRRPVRGSLGHTSRLDRTRTGAVFSFQRKRGDPGQDERNE